MALVYNDGKLFNSQSKIDLRKVL